MNYNADCLKSGKHDWCYKWSLLLDRMVREGVKGPLTQPMLAVPFPCTFEDDAEHCNCEEEVMKRFCRRGIPDPWNEYMVVKKGAEKGCLHPDEFPKKDLKITGYLGRNYRLDFGQGIPDPWKKCVMPKLGKEACLKRNFRDYYENLKTEMYETDKICCPNCNRQLLVFCLNEFGRRRRRRKRGEQPAPEEPMHEVEVENPVDEIPVDDDKVPESIPEERLSLKDACVETDDVKEEVQVLGVCKCKEHKSCECTIRRETKRNICACRKQEDSSDSSCPCTRRKHSCACQRNVHPPICIHNFLSFLPRHPPNQQWGSCQGLPSIPNEPQSIPEKDQQQCQSNLHLLSKVAQFPTQCDPYTWFPPGFFACGDRNGHFLELKWVCQKCDKGKKKRPKGKHKPADITTHECTPCRCKHSRQKNSRDRSPRFYDDEDDSESCGLFRISRVRHPENRRPSRCHCDEGTSNRGNASTEGKPDRDFIQLLQMLGCTDLYRNKRNTDYNEPMVNSNEAADPSQVASTSQRVTHAYVPTPSLLNPNFSHWKHKPKDTPVDPHRNESHNKRENTFHNAKPDRKAVTFQNRKPSPVTVKTTYSTIDRLRNVNTIVRRRNRGLFKKELDYFMSQCDTNWHNSDKSSSSETERKRHLEKGERTNVSGNSSRQDGRNPEKYIRN